MPTILTSFIFLSCSAFAQTVGGEYDAIFEWSGEEVGDYFGNYTAGAGDVNNDGIPDLVIGAPGGGLYGKAYVYSGLDGALIYQFDGKDQEENFGDAVAGAGDVNGDGFDDIIIAGSLSYFGAGVVKVYSGYDGTELHEWGGSGGADFLGWTVSGAGDVNQDGYDDVLIGAHARHAFLRSGWDGSIIYEWTGGYGFGVNVANAGDVNNDGIPDAIIGDLSSGYPGGWYKGAAHVFSGADGQLLYKFEGLHDDQHLGTSVSTAGDVNQDGFDDILIGSSGEYLFPPSSAQVFSGADGSLIYQWEKENSIPRYSGTSVASIGDFSGDGIPDIIYCNSSTDFHSGFDGSLIDSWEYESTGPWSTSRTGAAGVGDVNLDGFDDFIIPPPGQSPNSASVYGIFNPLMSASANEISISAGGSIQLQLDFPLVAANYEYRVLASASGVGPTIFGVAVPLTLDSLAQRSWYGVYPGVNKGNLQGILDANGDGFATVRITAGNWPELVGMVFHLAAIAMPPGELPKHSSVAVPITILP
jgi:hypothetical protein